MINLEIFTTLLLVILLLLIPGFLLFNLLIKDKSVFDYLEIIPISFSFGLFIFALIGFPSYIWHFSWSLFSLLFILISLILLGINIYLFWAKKRTWQLDEIKPSFWVALAIGLFSSVLVILMAKDVNYGDQIYHIGIARRLSSGSLISPYFNLFKDVIGKIDAAYGYNIWHLFLAFLIKTSNSDPMIIWANLIPILTPIEVFSFYFLARRFSKNNLFIIIAMSLFLITTGILTLGWEWRLSPYPDQIGRNLLVLVVLSLWLLFLKKEKIDFGIFLGILFLGVSLVLVHLFSLLYFLIAILGMMVFYFLSLKKYQITKKGLLVIVSWVILVAPILYFQYLSYQNIIPTNTGSTNYKILSLGKYFIVNPKIWNSPWTIFAIIAVIILFISFKFFKEKKLPLPILFGFVIVFFTVIVSFVPPLATFVSSMITSTYLARLVSLIPVSLLISYLIYFLLSNSFLRKYSLSIVIIVSLFAVGFSINQNHFISKVRQSSALPIFFLYQSPLYDFVANSINSDKVIAAADQNYFDQSTNTRHNTSYDLFAKTENYLVMIPTNHCPAIVDKSERIEDLDLILSSKSSISETQALLEQYQVDYVIARDEEISKFEKFPFEKIYDQQLANGHFTIYKVTF